MTPTSPSENDDQQPTGGGDRRRWLPIAIALAVVAVIAVVVFVVVRNDEEGGADATDVPVGPPRLPEEAEPQVDPEGEDLLELLEAGRGLTHHATYTGTDPTTGDLTIDVWRRDGQIRTDTRQVDDDGSTESSELVLDDGTVVSCSRANEGDWTCTREDAPSENALDTFFGPFAQQLQDQDVAVADDEIDGRAVRCFSGPNADDESDVSFCITPDGLPVRLRRQGAELLLTDLSDEVPEDTFTAPAPIGADQG